MAPIRNRRQPGVPTTPSGFPRYGFKAFSLGNGQRIIPEFKVEEELRPKKAALKVKARLQPVSSFHVFKPFPPFSDRGGPDAPRLGSIWNVPPELRYMRGSWKNIKAAYDAYNFARKIFIARHKDVGHPYFNPGRIFVKERKEGRKEVMAVEKERDSRRQTVKRHLMQ